jgi:L-ascorbate metabolism protein UlaG (beta-lactamase superfamily)
MTLQNTSMDIQFYGANCVTLSAQGTRVVVDDNLADLGAKAVARAGDVLLFTGAHADPAVEAKLAIDGPGDYEVGAFSIHGIPARVHIDEPKQANATMYRLEVGDVSALVVGHIYPDLSDDELEQIGQIDVLLVPVGGNGYTLDPAGALKVIKQIEPKVVIPTHYADKSLNFPVPQQSLEDALKGLAMEPSQTTGKLKLRPSDLTDTLQLVVLEKQ